MSEYRLISPLLDGFVMGGPISDHDGVVCCPAMRENADDKYIVKIISIPASQVQVDALLLSGAYHDRASVLAYFKNLAEGNAREAEILKQLSRLEGFTPYERWQIVPKENEVGYDLYLVGSYKRPLSRRMERQPMTHLAAVNLGLDMCAALAVCRRAGFLYVDLKPENIYVFDEQTYRIGDLGFIALSSLKYASLPQKYLSSFTAPEITDAFSSLNTTIDIYALGLVLYQIYNDGKLPFEGNAPAETFPAPAYADYEMSEIILKACAANPADRWQDPMEMGQALIDYMQRNGVNANPIVPLPVPPEVPAPAPEAEPEEAAEVSPEEASPEAGEASEEAEASEDAAPAADEVPGEAAPAAEEAPAEDSPEEDDESGAGEAAESAEAVCDDIPEDGADLQPADAAEDEPDAQDAPAAEPAADEAADSDADDLGDLSFIDNMNLDETSPSEDSALDLEGAVLTDEVSQILAQADELIAHELPAPAVAPEPIDVPMPERILPESESAEAMADDSEAKADSIAEPAPVNQPDVTNEPDDEDDDIPAAPRKKRRWLAWLIVLALLAGLAFGGYYYYQNYYLQTIESLTVNYADDLLNVNVLSQISDEELIVYCTDTYGNSQKSALVDGKASFTGLKPSTQYTITVESVGFHQLVGMTEQSFTTLAQTEIANFAAKTGAEDGSVILTFTVNGADPQSGWIINYCAEGEESSQVVTQDHWVTINGLTPGKNYSFTLSSGEDIRIVGSTGLDHVASNVILAQNAAIVSCEDGVLTAVWSAPENTAVDSWTVRCYNEAGYDQTIAVSTPSAVFSDVDTSSPCYLDITAAGQTQSAHTSITADPVTIINTLAEPVRNALNVQWTYHGNDPFGGWIISYTINGGAAKEFLIADSAFTIEPMIPGSLYAFTITTSDGRTVFNNAFVCNVEEADEFDSYKIDKDDMTFKMLLRPEKPNWTYRDAQNGPFTTTFTAGQKASFLVVLDHWQDKSRDSIQILYVVRDEAGVPVIVDTQNTTWNDMWDNGYCELDIPEIPAVPGSYTLEVYFNHKLANVTNFTVQ